MVCFYRLNARGFDDIDLAVFYRVALSDFGGAFCMGVRSSGAFNDFFFFFFVSNPLLRYRPSVVQYGMASKDSETAPMVNAG